MSIGTFEVTIDDLRAALASENSGVVEAITMNVVATTSSTADARLLARRRAELDRLRLSPSVSEADAATLGRAVTALGLALTGLRMSTAAERSTREGGELANEIREALAEPARPKDLIERTGADPAQVARVLRRLEQAGEVERAANPAGDGRERWYQVCKVGAAPVAKRAPVAAPTPTAVRASTVPQVVSPQDIKRLLRDVAPIKELRERGVISESTDPHQAAVEVCALYRVGDLTEQPSFALAARRSKSNQTWTPSQIAWVAWVRQRGESADVAAYDRDALLELASEIPRRLRTGTEHVTMLVPWLAECGVALVIEPGFSGAKLDGVAVSGANGNKIIGHSIRLDRFDSFVFTLLHEVAHILNGDIDSPGQICVDWSDESAADKSDQERVADQLALSLIFPDGLVVPKRVTTQWVASAARAADVHSSLVIGHAQHERRDWKTLTRHIPAVRDQFVGTW
jgi:HTH-type transcriptional regulator/antitoxin HigA